MSSPDALLLRSISTLNQRYTRKKKKNKKNKRREIGTNNNNNAPNNPNSKDLLLHLRKTRIKKLEEESVLCRYIFQKARHPKNLVDRTLYIQDPYLRRIAIAWRMNVLFSHSHCPKCNGKFNRAHISTCNLLTMNERTLEEKEKSALPLYCALDSYLNNGEFEDFGENVALIRFEMKESKKPP